jgi:GTP cyclohydrolase I
MLTPELNNMTMFEGTPFKSMITLRGHEVIALCPHHLMPVQIKAYVSYIPEQKIVGLSKLARAVEEHLTRPITQEELTDAIADTLVKSLRPKGVGVILTGTHGCMQYRGIRTHADVATSAMRGVYLDVAAAREEFLALSVGGRV